MNIHDEYNEIVLKVTLGIPFVIQCPFDEERNIVGQSFLGIMRYTMLRNRLIIRAGDYCYLPDDFLEFYKVEYDLYKGST